MKNLVIVESPAKARTIEKFLGTDFKVSSSMGHVRDLPKKNIGIDLEDFSPHYEVSPDKKKVITELKKLAKNKKVYLATDEDREGEAIAWHLISALGLKEKETERIVFHQITKNAILESLKNPRKLDQGLVDAQQGRRVIDRLVGYELSPLLWKKVLKGLSAGRVQSVAVKMVVEREREIRAFKPEEFWKIKSDLKIEKREITAELKKISGKAKKVGNEKGAKEIEKAIDKSKFFVKELAKKDTKRNPAPPFTTSTLQQEASRKLGFSVKQTMTVAQMLYEGIDLPEGRTGLITYMRTDSVNLAKEAIAEANKFINQNYGKEYSTGGRTFKTKAKGAQEAHEAIRPVSFLQTPEKLKSHLDKNQFRLYELIWQRALASQMKEAKLKKTVATFVPEKATKYEFQAEGLSIAFDGFMKVYFESHDDPEKAAEHAEKMLPEIKEGEKWDLKKLNLDQNFTKPPARYTEASLVKKLESEGIGRPSTYAPTISTIMARNYIEKKEKKLHPTDIAEVVTDFLEKNFSDIMDYHFTAKLEEDFDQVSLGKTKWKKIVKDFYSPFHKKIEATEKVAKRGNIVDEDTDEVCDKCGKPMIIKLGRFGKFLSCSGFPDCKNAKPLGEEGKAPEPELTDEKCPECEKNLVVKQGRFGKFMGCSGYPDCKYIKKEKAKEPVKIGIMCPECGKEIVEKRTRRGKVFYGCSGYPKCKFAAWDKPLDKKCKSCGGMLTENKKGEKCAGCGEIFSS